MALPNGWTRWLQSFDTSRSAAHRHPWMTTRTRPHTAAPAERQLSARIAIYAQPGEPPYLEEISDPDAAVLVERVYEAAARRARPPVAALREIIENLVHAEFRDALVSVFEHGHVVRVSDSGPGIADHRRAMQPGYTTATAEQRRLVRGVGSGLPLAAHVVDAEGGAFELDANLAGGTVVTLSVPVREFDALEATVPDDARILMALLLETGPARPDALAAELGWTVGRCGRELVALEARGLVTRRDDGARVLDESGASLLASLF